MSLISLNEALKRSDYSELIKEKVKAFIIENYRNYSTTSNIYLTKTFNKNIFVIKMDLYVNYKEAEYILTILIYIPDSFPNELRIYFEYNQDFFIENYYQDQKIIDDYTAELYYGQIINFIPLKQPLTQLIKAFTDKFNQKFPLFKSTQKPEYIGPCHFDEKNITKIEIKPDDLIIVDNLAETRKRIKNKILQTLDAKIFEMQSTISQLEGKKAGINNQINNYLSKSANNELEEMNSKIKDIKSKLQNDIQKLNYQEKKGVLELCEEIVEIKNRNKFKYTVIKKNLEHFLIFITKSFEKKLIDFRQAVDETREISKELFYVNYLIQKND